MTSQNKPEAPLDENRVVWDRRNPMDDPRQNDRRNTDKRRGERRMGGRRKEFCPTCEGELTSTATCPSCKVRVIRIRSMAGS